MRNLLFTSFMAAGVLLMPAPTPAAEGAPFCMQKANDGSTYCTYQTIAACEDAKRTNPQSDPADLCLIRSLADGWRVHTETPTTTGQDNADGWRVETEPHSTTGQAPGRER